MTGRSRERSGRPRLVHPHEVDEGSRGFRNPTLTAGAVLAGAAGLAVLGAGTAAADDGDGFGAGLDPGADASSSDSGGFSDSGSAASSAGSFGDSSGLSDTTVDEVPPMAVSSARWKRRLPAGSTTDSFRARVPPRTRRRWSSRPSCRSRFRPGSRRTLCADTQG